MNNNNPMDNYNKDIKSFISDLSKNIKEIEVVEHEVVEDETEEQKKTAEDFLLKVDELSIDEKRKIVIDWATSVDESFLTEIIKEYIV